MRGAAAFYAPESYGIGEAGAIHVNSLIEMSLGVAIGAVTFTGSIIAWGKLQGVISGKPVTFAGQHMVNAALGIALLVLIVALCVTQVHDAVLGDHRRGAAAGRSDDHSDRRRDMPVIVRC